MDTLRTVAFYVVEEESLAVILFRRASLTSSTSGYSVVSVIRLNKVLMRPTAPTFSSMPRRTFSKHLRNSSVSWEALSAVYSVLPELSILLILSVYSLLERTNRSFDVKTGRFKLSL